MAAFSTLKYSGNYDILWIVRTVNTAVGTVNPAMQSVGVSAAWQRCTFCYIRNHTQEWLTEAAVKVSFCNARVWSPVIGLTVQREDVFSIMIMHPQEKNNLDSTTNFQLPEFVMAIITKSNNIVYECIRIVYELWSHSAAQRVGSCNAPVGFGLCTPSSAPPVMFLKAFLQFWVPVQLIF